MGCSRTRDYIAGNKFSAADLYVGAELSWMTQFGIFEKRPSFMDYIARLQARPAAKRAREIDDAIIAKQKAAG